MKNNIVKIILAVVMTSMVLAGCGKASSSSDVWHRVESDDDEDEDDDDEDIDEDEIEEEFDDLSEDEATFDSADLANQDEWKEAYTALLKKADAGEPLGIVTGEDWVDENEAADGYFTYGYYIYDITGNGTPEIIIRFGTCEADYNDRVFTYDGSDEAKFIGIIWSGHSAFYTYPGPGIVRQTAHMGYASVSKVTYSGNGFVEDMIYEESGYNDAGEWDDSFEYTEVADIVDGAEYVEYMPLSDFSALNDYIAK